MALEFPTIFLLPAHIHPDKLPELEASIPSLTYNVNEAEIILGKIVKKERALFELRCRDIQTEEIPPLISTPASEPPPPKRRRVLSSASDSSTASDSEPGSESGEPHNRPGVIESDLDTIKVVRLAWFTDSQARGQVLPLDDYLVYQGRVLENPTPPLDTAAVLRRAKDEGEHGKTVSKPSHSSHHTRVSSHAKPPKLLMETTSEHDMPEMPPIPEYLSTTYSCQRATHNNPPNDAFIQQLKKVRKLRILEGDDIGERAYSTAIAVIAAYPHVIHQASEVLRLPGCSDKIAGLFREWKEHGCLPDVENQYKQPRLHVLNLFYDIWGVGATTAREFYNKGWRDLDDVVEQGWLTISRVQQIGVKYYDELQEKIPRAEVADIGKDILEHASLIREGFQMVIVGGYRRGNPGSSDVDVILSHPDIEATHNFIDRLVTFLTKTERVTHTLTLSTKNSERDQVPLPWKGGQTLAGSGFDTLDKALVVWQSPYWDTRKTPKNPNPHRRVDIIVSPWRTAGCAVLGWSGATTFERDLRRYCKQAKGWKFDSSGIRSRADGEWIDLESRDGRPAPDMLTAEKRVFEGLGLEWRPPEERCTG
ncbi:Nucleotidyltransferase [Xylariomycetidae sp. FL2044]|nr:Nucleotidyltransferase [Xylariomycetidae sp. FL2044]